MADNILPFFCSTFWFSFQLKMKVYDSFAQDHCLLPKQKITMNYR